MKKEHTTGAIQVLPSWKASIFPFPYEQGNVKEKVQKLFQKPGGGSPFWKK
jgi:hypothetical protein